MPGEVWNVEMGSAYGMEGWEQVMEKTLLVPAAHDGIAAAAHILCAGGVVAFPTDTVYGLACDLSNIAAVERIYQIKGRPAQMPLIAMFATPSDWEQVAMELSDAARDYMARWWPGSLTIIARARPELPASTLGGGTTIGMRIPDQPAARALLQLVGRPLATTSANLSGHPAPTTVQAIIQQLDGSLDLVLDAGLCPGGTASTVVDCTVTPPRILREGPITAAMLGL